MRLVCQKVFVVVLYIACRVASASSIDLTTATVVIPDDAAEAERAAAEDLVFFFEEMTGRHYPVVAENAVPMDGARIFLGGTRAAGLAGIDSSVQPPQGARWLTKGKDLFIVGGTPSGTGFGVNRLLGEVFGCYQFDYDFHSAPKRSALIVPDLDVTKAPMIRSRYIHTWNSELWMTPAYAAAKTNVLRRNFLLLPDEDCVEPGLRVTRRMPIDGHTYYEYIPPERWGQVHPEWYSLDENGKRGPSDGPDGQLCLTNPDMRREACRVLEEMATADLALPEGLRPNLYDLSQRDTCFTHLCWCSNCLARVDELGGDSDLNMEFVNEAARALASVNPKALLRTFAYECTEKPLVTMRPETNVIVRYCDYYAKRCDLQPLTNAVNAVQYRLYSDWVKSGCRLSVWQYCLPNYSQPQMAGGYGVPGVAIDAIIADTELYRRDGLEGVFFQSDYPGYLPRSFQFLQYFLAAQLFFDRDQDPEKLIEAYLEGVYGPAAEEMGEYLGLLRGVQQRNPITTVDDWQYRRFLHIAEPGFIPRALELLRAAEEKVAGDRLRKGKVAVEYADVLHGAILFGLAEKRAESIDEFEKQTRLHFDSLPYVTSRKNELEKLLADEVKGLRKGILALSAKDYVTDGLIAHWDGIENVHSGEGPDTSASQWNDLSGKSPPIPLPKNARFEKKGLRTVRANGSQPTQPATAILDVVQAESYTVEVAYDMPAESPVAYDYVRMLTLGHDDYWVGAFVAGNALGLSPVHDAWGGGLTRTASVRPSCSGEHSFSCAQRGGDVWIRVDGTNEYSTGMSTAQDIRALNHGFRFNRGYYEDVGLDGLYHSIRIYNRRLTDDERKINLAIDRVRFFGWSAATAELPVGWRFAVGEDVRLERFYRIGSAGGGKVSVCGGEPVSAVDFWGEKGSLDLRAVPDAGYEFARWEGVPDEVSTRVEGTFATDGNATAVFRKTGLHRLSAKSYVTNGLVALWDGEENVAFGIHDDASLRWNNLAGTAYIDCPAGSAFCANGLVTKRDNGSHVIGEIPFRDAFTNTHYSVQVAYNKMRQTTKATTGWANELCAMFVLGWSEYPVGTAGDDRIGFSPSGSNWHGKGCGHDVLMSVSPETTMGHHTFSCSHDTDGTYAVVADRVLSVTGVVSPESPPAQAPGTHRYWFNRSWYDGFGLDGVYHSVRYYARALRTDEVLVNQAVDQVRFFGADAADAVLPDGWRFNVTDGVRLERRHSVSTADPRLGLVSADGGAAVADAAIWVDHDAPSRVKVSAVPARGCRFIRWVGAVAPEDGRVQSGNLLVSGDIRAEFEAEGFVLVVR